MASARVPRVREEVLNAADDRAGALGLRSHFGAGCPGVEDHVRVARHDLLGRRGPHGRGVLLRPLRHHVAGMRGDETSQQGPSDLTVGGALRPSWGRG